MVEPEKRDRILLAVLEVIAERGISAVTMRSVASQAAVSLGLVQHYFQNKQALIRAAASFMVQLAEAEHRSQPPRSAAAQLRGLLLGGIKQAGAAPLPTSVFFAFVAAAATDPEIAELLAAARVGMVGEVERLLGEVAPGLSDSAIEAGRLVGLGDGLTIQVLIGQVGAEVAVAAMADAVDALSSGGPGADLTLNQRTPEVLGRALSSSRGSQPR